MRRVRASSRQRTLGKHESALSLMADRPPKSSELARSSSADQRQKRAHRGAQTTKMQNGCPARSANAYKGSSGSSVRSSRITAPRATARCRCRSSSARLGTVRSRCNCVHVVANRLGHSDPAVTLRVYAHVLRESVAGVADVFAKTLERAGVSKSVSKKVAEYNETRGSTL